MTSKSKLWKDYYKLYYFKHKISNINKSYFTKNKIHKLLLNIKKLKKYF